MNNRAALGKRIAFGFMRIKKRLITLTAIELPYRADKSEDLATISSFLFNFLTNKEYRSIICPPQMAFLSSRTLSFDSKTMEARLEFARTFGEEPVSFWFNTAFVDEGRFQ